LAPTQIRLTGEQWAEVVAHLEACRPEEGCGLLAGRADRVEIVLPIENIDHSPVRYRMEARALVAGLGRIEDLGLDLLGAFHSHPAGPPGVSESDLREWQYPESALIVCAPGAHGAWQIRAFRADEGGVVELRVLRDGD
jgi:proteasome lid subunit RPN8/RPN11